MPRCIIEKIKGKIMLFKLYGVKIMKEAYFLY
ncbi:hypothetical protein N288_01960 [Bacillus infantis NRRL B-14911]|uniref:Uncharacterized protein n=1 Tax=Bacillus infantis NRRL B-14911 TaxID=1367477 RepID=U5L4A6_9BACI|nr:hypothetical protein N288_01960 [Bacillus infantis NRRL B-14911]